MKSMPGLHSCWAFLRFCESCNELLLSYTVEACLIRAILKRVPVMMSKLILYGLQSHQKMGIGDVRSLSLSLSRIREIGAKGLGG